MPQILYSKDHGAVSFDKTWVMGQSHVGLLTGGGYAHISGHALTRKEDGLSVIPPGPDQEAFIEWWENKDKKPIEEVKRKIIVNPDGSYSFDDGAPITQAQELIGYFGSGDALEQALRWFALELVRQEGIKKAMASKAGHMAVKAKGAGPHAAAPKMTGHPAKSPPETSGPPEVAVKD